MREREALMENGVRQNGAEGEGWSGAWLFCHRVLSRYPPVALVTLAGLSLPFCRGFADGAVDVCRLCCGYLLPKFSPMVLSTLAGLSLPFVEVFVDRAVDICRPFGRYHLSRFSPIALLMSSVCRPCFEGRGKDTRSGSACPLQVLKTIPAV